MFIAGISFRCEHHKPKAASREVKLRFSYNWNPRENLSLALKLTAVCRLEIFHNKMLLFHLREHIECGGWNKMRSKYTRTLEESKFLLHMIVVGIGNFGQHFPNGKPFNSAHLTLAIWNVVRGAFYLLRPWPYIPIAHWEQRYWHKRTSTEWRKGFDDYSVQLLTDTQDAVRQTDYFNCSGKSEKHFRRSGSSVASGVRTNNSNYK